jgi:DNA replication protein DnaC
MPINMQADVCALCDGTGWKTLPARAGARGDRRVTRCDCQIEERTRLLLAASRIPPRYEHCELANFQIEGRYASLAPARMASSKFVEEYPLNKTGLLLVGSVGIGKTHLAVGIIKELIRDKRVSCLFCDYRELLKQIQNSYNDTVQTTELEVLRPVFETEVLVLDELGAVRPSEWIWDTLNLILNTRYNENLTTVFTTNFPDGASAKSEAKMGMNRVNRDDTLGDRIGDRMRSRLLEMCRVINMQGEDFRQKLRGGGLL